MLSLPPNDTAPLQHNVPTPLSTITMFSFYLASVAGFLIIVISGLVLIRTQYALEAIAQQQQQRQPSPSSTAPKPQNTYTNTENDTESAFNQDDMAATAAMRRARAFALFGPLSTIPTLLSIPIALHFNRVGDVTVRVMLSGLQVAIIHCANACTLQTYFGLVRDETRMSFGSEICSARKEMKRGGWLRRMYVTVLCYVSLPFEGQEKDEVRGPLKSWKLSIDITYGSRDEESLFVPSRPSEDFADTDSMDSMELKRLV